MDLLHWGPARLAVSSNVKNPRDYPEHLVDGNNGTAWNSRTGDLVGASIAFEVPSDATIESLVLSAGFDKIDAAGNDLFLMNHRVRSIEVFAGSMETKPLATFQLDPARREPQSFAFAHPGGLYWVKVTAVEPGTKKEWRELAISEFRVMGIPGKTRYGMPRIPDVAIAKEWVSRPLPGVGDPDAPSYQDAIGSAFPSINALCKHLETKLAPGFAKNGLPAPGKEACVTKPVSVPAPLPAPIKGISWLDLMTPEGSAGMYVLQTDKGFVVPRNAELQSANCEPGCMDDMLRTDTRLEKLESSAGNVTLHVKQTSTSSEAFDEHGMRTSATDTRWFSLKCALTPEPVTCARVDTKSSCLLGTAEVACR
ncbi:hypothetical protein AKJ09_01572 [Labilithrix luteola]|uniref:F5/8 type C domain-containing protein n=1 Tax=Labilithrix luteola TaxID=1391654 RepID=A0A0K1PN03_9BACT|nr:hypothetical protein AKJ09_01572 [Labilithrix luteola]